MATPLPMRTLFPRHLQPRLSRQAQVLRAFSTSPELRRPSFLDLQARSVSRENGHFSKLSGTNYIEHSPALQLLRSERDLAEGKNGKEPEGILLTKKSKSDHDGLLLAELQAQVATLQGALSAKERGWRDRWNHERKEWADLEERSLRLRLMFFVSLVFMGLLAADSIMLADDIEEHCPGCFAGNTKNDLFVVGYLKAATEKAARWFRGEQVDSTKKTAMIKKHEQKPTLTTSAKDNVKVKALPQGWEEMKTPDGKVYFANHNDRSTSWHDPRVEVGKAGLPAGWEELKARDGRAYFTNHIEKYTTWDDPRIPKKPKASAITKPVDNSSNFLQRLMWAR